MFDPELYRPKEEVERWKERDPIALFRTHLSEREWLDEKSLAAMQSEVEKEIADAVRFAEESPWEAAEELLRDVCGV
jgi:TPP-dependent pyruvate/acetoin dehydrogenase alpha subunit